MENNPQNASSQNDPQNPTRELTSNVSSAAINKHPTVVIIGVVVCALIAITGCSLGVYGITDSNQKNEQISTLTKELEDKKAQISTLSSTSQGTSTTAENGVASQNVATPETKTEIETTPETGIDGGSASVALGEILDQNDARTVYKISDCTADGPSVKCRVTIGGKDGMISWVSTDNILRLTIPNE